MIVDLLCLPSTIRSIYGKEKQYIFRFDTYISISPSVEGTFVYKHKKINN